jgi:hypothetical protein
LRLLIITRLGIIRHIDTSLAVDAPRFVALLAATSPQTGVEDNAINALNIWANWIKAGRPQDEGAIKSIIGASVQGELGEESVLPAWLPNTMRALTAEDPEKVILSGPKVDSFMRNLRGEVNAVTLDTWMANYSLITQAMFAAARAPIKGATSGESRRIRLALLSSRAKRDNKVPAAIVAGAESEVESTATAPWRCRRCGNTTKLLLRILAALVKPQEANRPTNQLLNGQLFEAM